MTSIEPGPGWAERLNPRNWTLTWKLVVVGLVPALLALALGVLRIADDADQAAELGRSSRLVEIRDQVAGAANALRQERDESTLYVAGNRTGDRGVLEIGHGQADGEIDEMVNALGGTGELDPATGSALRQVEDGLGQLAKLRSDVTDNAAVPSDLVVRRYSDLIGPIDVLDRALLRQLRTPGTAGLADAITAVTDAVEQLSVEHTVLGAAIRSGRQMPGDAALLNVATAQLLADYRDYQAAVTPDELSRFGAFLEDPVNTRRDQLKAAILAAPPGQPTVPATDWDAAYGGSRGAADSTADQIRGELISASTAAENRASNLAGINSVILMLGLLVGISIAVLVARALVRSLRVLRTSALDVAERRLPQTVESVRAGDTPDITVAPVPLTGRDEVVQVARAFDAVHRQAIRLAADQATLQAGISAMFVNLSRRSQALVERQLQLIEQLEANEQDADQLSNLFQLDHLATRMRRNSENLLVLAGTDLAKRNVAAVPMVDVLRAAVSEVEQYQRIVVQSPPTSTILGRAASDIVHLLAELLDNATNFSPPDSQVVMSSTRTADGAIVVEIADRGVGMTDDELVAANSRMAGPGSVDVSTSRRMGLIVVGRLAARHGVDVRLSSSASGGSGSGLTASVTVPTKLVPTSEPRRSGALAGTGMARQPGGPAAAAAAGGPPQQRNGAPGRPGAPLAALVAGTDGPPAAPPPDRPPTPAPPTGNGSVNGLPTRQPGSSLRAAGPTPFDRRGPEQLTPGPTPFDRPGGEPPAATAPPLGRRAPEPPAADPTVADRPGSEHSGSERQGADRPGSDRPGADRPGADRTGADRTGADRTGAKRTAADRPGAGQLGAGAEPPVDRPVDVGPPADRPIAATAGPELTGRAPADSSADPNTPPTGRPRTPPAQRLGAAPRPTPFAPVDRPEDRNNPTDPAGLSRGEGFPTGFPTGRPAGEPDRRPTPRTDPTPVVDQPAAGLPQRRPSPQRRPDPRPFARDDVPGGRPHPDRRPAAQPTDGLFSSQMPAVPEPEPDVRPGPQFDPNETTPIFEEIASAWFRSNRSVPVQYGPDQDEPAPAPAAVQRPVAPAEPATPPVPFSAPVPAPAPPRPAPENQPAPGLVSAEHGFASLADEGWRAARGATTSRGGDELTPAGLPKRRPRARLVPGSAGSAVLASVATPSRNAESVRGRLSSYQQGVRMGRENRQRGDTESTPLPEGGTEQANAQGNHDEESS